MSTLDLVFGIPPIVAFIVGFISWWIGKNNIMIGGICSLIASAVIAIFVIFIHAPGGFWLSLLLLIQYPTTISSIIYFWAEPSDCGLDKF